MSKALYVVVIAYGVYLAALTYLASRASKQSSSESAAFILAYHEEQQKAMRMNRR